MKALASAISQHVLEIYNVLKGHNVITKGVGLGKDFHSKLYYLCR